MRSRPRRVSELTRGEKYGYFLDVAASSFKEARVESVISSAATIFVNAVMGFTASGFHEGTEALDAAIAANASARKYFGGGDTIQEFKSLSPGLYMARWKIRSFTSSRGGNRAQGVGVGRARETHHGGGADGRRGRRGGGGGE